MAPETGSEAFRSVKINKAADHCHFIRPNNVGDLSRKFETYAILDCEQMN